MPPLLHSRSLPDSLAAHLTGARSGSLEAIVHDRYFRVLTSKSLFDYFLHRGLPRGFQVQIPMLEAGHGDLIAARLTVTPERAKRVLFSRTYYPVEEWVVDRKDETRLNGPEDL